MGEMADFAIEEMLTHEEFRLDYKLGRMSIEKAIDCGVVDEQGYEYGPYTGLIRELRDGSNVFIGVDNER